MVTKNIVANGIQIIIQWWLILCFKKEFNLINHVSFENLNYPFRVDISITQFGNRGPDRFRCETRKLVDALQILIPNYMY
jgi:hypothetical protein